MTQITEISPNDQYRNVDERRNETLNIIYQLKQNNITTNDVPSIKDFIGRLNEYVVEGKSTKFKLELPELNKVIHAFLPIHKKFKCEVVIKQN